MRRSMRRLLRNNKFSTNQLMKQILRTEKGKLISSILLIGLMFLFVTFIFSIYYADIQYCKENYTELTATVTRKYQIRHTRHRSRYIDVQYSLDGEEKTAEKLRPSFWEKEGSVVQIYIKPDGTIYKTSFPLSPLDFIIMIAVITAILVMVGKKYGMLPEKEQKTVGIVLDDDLTFDLPESEDQDSF